MDWSTPNLEELLATIWGRLEQGCRNRQDAWHTAALATVNNGRPAVRTVVLRSVDPSARELVFFSDVRANKVRQLTDRPRAEWLFYDAAARVQLRALGTATLHHMDPMTEAVWRSKPDLNYLDYLSPLAPGTSLPASLPEEGAREPEQDIVFRNFAVFVNRIEWLDWLMLDEVGHRRASFQWDGERFEARWVIP